MTTGCLLNVQYLLRDTHLSHARCGTTPTQVPLPPQLHPWLRSEGVHMLQQYVGVVRAALDRVMGMQVCRLRDAYV